MIVVAMDTSAAASVAVVERDEATGTETVHAEWTEFGARKHAELLGPALLRVAEEAGITGESGPSGNRTSGNDTENGGLAVVAGVGPGPFTGLRAGIATAIGYAIGRGVPVYGVPSHEALALRAYSLSTTSQSTPSTAPAADPLVVATDARRKEVYWTAFAGLDEAGLPVVSAGPAVATPADLAGSGHLGDAASGGSSPRRYGRGFALYAEVLGAPAEDVPEALEPTAAWLGRVALRRLAAGRPLLDTSPLYLREADARPSPARPSVFR
ncbi:tRNA (adenosine(37)-N6)-threonylcarbamoyltransferase complex dimerization subunit type 1 TsaB [Brevibacterium litoralis]|uniref:tRNA (adenosine(37)-N6)-threonylcarbamoyltransferase complex dimerization subunit type 1 TsaB n=1 Tax=Brevibacterium litoralis TaxID=3138935 RepID=UPI0032EFEEE8